jgi:hemerythrin-like domain-containing protein
MAQPVPNLAQDLIRIHKVITRAIDVDLIKGKQYIKNGFASSQEQAGYASYTHSFIEVLDAHHTSEDTIVFPELHHVLPSAPYAMLTAEHHQVERILSVMRPALSELSVDALVGLTTILDSLQKLSTLWAPHYQLEEKNFTAEAINAVFSPEDQLRLSDLISKNSQEHSGPPYWVIPFVLFNLDGEDRAAMAASIPPIVMEELLPNTWKDQWAPMKPLLLD